MNIVESLDCCLHCALGDVRAANEVVLAGYKLDRLPVLFALNCMIAFRKWVNQEVSEL